MCMIKPDANGKILAFLNSCDSIKDSSLLETVDDNLWMGLNRLSSRNERTESLCFDNIS